MFRENNAMAQMNPDSQHSLVNSDAIMAMPMFFPRTAMAFFMEAAFGARLIFLVKPLMMMKAIWMIVQKVFICILKMV